MSLFVSRTVAKAMLLKAIALEFMIESFGSLVTCIMAALSGCLWSELTPQMKFTMVLGITANWLKAVSPTIQKGIKVIEQEANGNNDTGFIKKPTEQQFNNIP